MEVAWCKKHVIKGIFSKIAHFTIFLVAKKCEIFYSERGLVKKSLDYFPRQDSLQEKCGIFGAYGQGFEAARLAYYGLWALQHRGQESSGISSSDGKVIRTHKGEGLVAHVYKEEDLDWLEGHIAIGHNRYGTSGGTGAIHAQPIVSRDGGVALAHNGNLPSTVLLEKFLHSKRIKTDTLNDSEMMQRCLQYFLNQGKSIEVAIEKSFPLFTGAFCLVLLTKTKLIALRDARGIRPLSLGKLNGGYIVASETAALDTVQAKFIRDVKPGEMIVIDKKGLHSYQLEKGQQKLDIFEFIYFSRPDSMLLGKNVNEVRKNLGRLLAKECKISADVVIPVPDSAIPAAIGFAEVSGIPFDHGLIKNRYIHRTFIRPDQHLRERDVMLKLNPLRSVIQGKRVVVIDDSIVRGTTSKKIVSLLRRAGAKKVHMLSSCPPIRFPDFYGINTPVQNELIAAAMPIEKIREYIGADSVCFLSYQGMIAATGLPESVFSLSLFNGDYPIDIREKKEEINYNLRKDPLRIAVLISNSGTGTNLQSIIDAIEKKKILGKIAVVVSDTSLALGLNRARKYGIPVHILESKTSLTSLLQKTFPVDYVVLAGWKKIIPDAFLDAFPKRILNIHPGLIPNTLDGVIANPDGTPAHWNRGKFTEKAITHFLQTNATYAGSTVHFLSKEFDFGEVLQRCFEKIKPHDTVASLYKRLKKQENTILIQALSKL